MRVCIRGDNKQMAFIDRFTQGLSDNKKKVFANIFWAMTGKIVNMAGALLVGILVARYLGPAQYGLMNYVISYVALFTVISNFGLDDIEIRELSRQPDKKDYILGTCIRIRFGFALLAFLLIVATLLIFRTDTFTSVMIIVYSVTLFTGCFNLIRNYFTSIVKNEYVVKSEITRTIIGACIKIVLLWIKAPLEFFIAATMFDTILVASGYCISYKRTVGKISNWKYDPSIVSFYIKEAFPLVLSGAAVIIYQRIDQVMIGNMIDKESVGYFATAGKFLDLILFLPMVLTQTITPLLVKAKERAQKEYEYKKQQFVSIVVWVAILLAVFVSLFAYWLIHFTYGDKYLLAVPILQIMAFKTVGMALSSSSGQIIIMERIQKWAFIRNIIGCLICVGFNLLLIPQYGVIGSAWVTIFTVLFSGFISNILIPAYRDTFKIQLYALLLGWKDLFNIKNILK